RDARVGRALGSRGRALVPHGTPYAVSPGRVRTAAGAPYQVFTPFSRAWRAHGWPAPAPEVETRWVHGVPGEPLPTAAAFDSGPVGEDAALRRWEEFRDHDLAQYAEARDRPDLDATSRLSVPLKYGEIHPRTLLADLAASPPAGEHADASVDRFVAELCWREFYADVLWHRPDAAWRDLRTDLAALAYDSGPEVDALVESWRRGSTGFPLVDAGMRHLLAEGWMPNRVRMVAASFLVKDLHVWWPVGARHFLDHLLDGDLASNSGGWQWTAGTGTDAAPYFRVFNPVSQGLRFDPHGDYVRRWVPELRHLPGPAAHRPWEHPEGLSRGYPPPAVDHAAERADALARYRVAGLGPREASGRGSSG
ncbi:MAG TPA: deoxyribodipyrimidine photo-lyase, partial [Nocardioides sp.]|uniref:cryptochrome/photolyase family protein n=1 Tax=Nocardioides sp. TaxID=35761 RepID=UPI002BDD546E